MTTDRTRRTIAVRPGFTLAEATLAMVLLGIAAAGVLLPFSGGAAAQAEGARRTLGAVLANDLIERIAGTPYDRIVDTYDGWDEAEGQLTDADGALLSDAPYAHFSREATCAWDPGQDFFILATVTVRHQGRPVATIQRLIGK
jgi:type II secretory pathway pseudopilin PulG